MHKRILRGLLAFVHAVIPLHMCDTQPVIGQDTSACGASSASGLRCAMRGLIAPSLHGLFITPERQAQEFARHREAFKTLNADEAIDVIKLRAKLRCQIKVAAVLAFSRPEFKNNGDHGAFQSARRFQAYG